MHVCNFKVFVYFCIDNIFRFEGDGKTVRLIFRVQNQLVQRFKVGMLDIRCFLSVSLRALAHQLFDEGLVYISCVRIFRTKS